MPTLVAHRLRRAAVISRSGMAMLIERWSVLCGDPAAPVTADVLDRARRRVARVADELNHPRASQHPTWPPLSDEQPWARCSSHGQAAGSPATRPAGGLKHHGRARQRGAIGGAPWRRISSPGSRRRADDSADSDLLSGFVVGLLANRGDRLEPVTVWPGEQAGVAVGHSDRECGVAALVLALAGHHQGEVNTRRVQEGQRQQELNLFWAGYQKGTAAL